LKNNKRQSRFSVISRNVNPVQWDASGNVITVTIHTKDEKVFWVEHTKIGNELLKLGQAKVEVRGKIRERIDGKTSIGVRAYELTNKQTENNVVSA
jgi:hypothetical protein